MYFGTLYKQIVFLKYKLRECNKLVQHDYSRFIYGGPGFLAVVFWFLSPSFVGSGDTQEDLERETTC
jgi:hypothetical protein